MMNRDAKDVVLNFWAAMGTNDFYAAAELLSEDYVGIWPQSNELIRGRENFGQVNSAYPANGRWHFTINRVVCEGSEVVTDVSITDGTIEARAISFSTVRDGLIAKQIEYWPDPMPAAEWRQEWVESWVPE